MSEMTFKYFHTKMIQQFAKKFEQFFNRNFRNPVIRQNDNLRKVSEPKVTHDR
jgi:hypothetical protein